MQEEDAGVRALCGSCRSLLGRCDAGTWTLSSKPLSFLWNHGQTTVMVLASTNLQDWTPVCTNTLVNGTNDFADANWTNYPVRFYRVITQ